MSAGLVEAVERLGTELGLGPIAFSATGLCGLRLGSGDELTLELGRDRDTLHLHTRVQPLGPEGPERGLLYEAMLIANHPDTVQGPALAVDPVAEEAVLCQAVQEPEIAAAGGLKPLVAQFERELERVRSVLEAERQAVEEGPPVDADNVPFDPLLLHARFLRA
jgi:hypothetical protein